MDNKDNLIEELRKVALNADGAYRALAAYGIDKYLPGYAGCVKKLREVLEKQK